MGYIVIAPVGDNLKALFVGMKEFPTERVVLITPEGKHEEARKLAKKLDEFTITAEILPITGSLMEQMFIAFGKVCSLYNNDSIIVNVATGDRLSTCAALSAAYANGLKAIGVMGDKTMMLPIMKLSYYSELSENKLKILKKLDGQDFTSLKSLSKGLNMSTSLLSYHLNGNYKYKGLKEFRLVEIKEENKSVFVKLSSLGRLLLKGYIKKRDETN